jgi:uncharacterized glyoxalase superfamily protein PhnB
MLERQGAQIMLEEIKNPSMNGDNRTWIPAPMEIPFGRGINLQIKTSNVDKLYQRTKQAGANIFLPLEEKWYRANNEQIGNRQFIILDPDGYMLRFTQVLGMINSAPPYIKDRFLPWLS